jgi:hypothetical protein
MVVASSAVHPPPSVSVRSGVGLPSVARRTAVSMGLARHGDGFAERYAVEKTGDELSEEAAGVVAAGMSVRQA